MLNIILTSCLILLAIVKISVATLVGSCNECFASNKIACLDETHFATCFQGSPTVTVTKCPGNRFCTDDVLICHSSAEGYTPICYHDYCGDCEVTNGIFTCVDETTYGYCFGGKTPLKGSLRSCPQGYVCNYNSREVCVPEDTHEPSCASKITTTTSATTITTESTTTDQTTTTEMTTETTTEITSTTTTEMTTLPTSTTTNQQTESTTETTITTPTTTTAMPRDPNTICGEIGKTGYFKSDDPTCKEYIYCYLLSGQYLGWIYYCDGYFNAATQKCQMSRPSDCVAY